MDTCRRREPSRRSPCLSRDSTGCTTTTEVLWPTFRRQRRLLYERPEGFRLAMLSARGGTSRSDHEDMPLGRVRQRNIATYPQLSYRRCQCSGVRHRDAAGVLLGRPHYLEHVRCALRRRSDHVRRSELGPTPAGGLRCPQASRDKHALPCWRRFENYPEGCSTTSPRFFTQDGWIAASTSNTQRRRAKQLHRHGDVSICHPPRRFHKRKAKFPGSASRSTCTARRRGPVVGDAWPRPTAGGPAMAVRDAKPFPDAGDVRRTAYSHGHHWTALAPAPWISPAEDLVTAYNTARARTITMWR